MKSMEAANSPRGAGEFDPREGFFPQSLMPQVERLAGRENAMPADLLPPRQGNGRRAVLVIALLVVALLVALIGAAYWYGTQAAAPEPVAAPAPASAQNAATGAVLPTQIKAVGTAPLVPAPAPPVAATLQVQPVANASDAPAEKSPPPPRGARLTASRNGSRGRSAPAPAAEQLAPVEAPLPYTGGVTHTHGAAPAAAVIAAPPAVKSDTPSAASPASGACTPALAALGLCTPQKTGK